MKELLFKNKETGKLKAVYVDDRIRNIEAARRFKEANGKHWGLVMSRHQAPQKR